MTCVDRPDLRDNHFYSSIGIHKFPRVPPKETQQTSKWVPMARKDTWGAPILKKHEGCINMYFNRKHLRISLTLVLAVLHVSAVKMYTCMNHERVWDCLKRKLWTTDIMMKIVLNFKHREVGICEQDYRVWKHVFWVKTVGAGMYTAYNHTDI